jgi:N utilization substance protein A
MKNDLTLAIKHLSSERGLPREVVIQAIEVALVSAYKKTPQGTAQNVTVKLDPQSGRPQVLAEKEVVEEVKDDRCQITLAQARRLDPACQLGGLIRIDVTPADFGRIAAQTAKQVILQRIREAERDQLYAMYKEQEGEIIQGVVQSIEPTHITIALDKAEAILPRKEQIPRERYYPNQRLRVYVVEVKKTNKGPEITVSRTHRNMLRRLLELEVPEIFNGTVEIKAITREAGSRSKVAVAAHQDGVDPVGACVGLRGVRIQALVNELGGEKIDVIEWNPDPALFIAKALSPAMVLNVKLVETPDGKTANVTVPDKQLSLAIGKEGQNARLAAKLTGWRIDIKSESEAAQEAVRQAEEEARRAEQEALVLAARALLAEAEAVAGQADEVPVAVEVAAPPEPPVPPSVVEATAPEASPPAAEAEAVAPAVEPVASPEPAPAALVGPAGEGAGASAPTPVQTAPAPVEAVASAPAQPAEAAAPVPAGTVESLVWVESGEVEDEGDELQSRDKDPKKKKDKKKIKGKVLVYDERIGEVVVRTERKPGRQKADWHEELERVKPTPEDDQGNEEEENWRAYLPEKGEDEEEPQGYKLEVLADTDE